MTPRARMVVAAALALLGAACSGEPGGGRPITIYSGRSKELIQPIVDRFEQASKIRVEIRYADTAEVAAAIVDEGARTSADLFWAQDAGALGFLESRDLLADLPADLLGLVPARYRSRAGKWIGVTGRVRVLAYNPDMVKEADLPGSVEGLTDPAWKGKVGWAPTNGSFQAFVTAFRRAKGEAAAREWLEAMKANEAQAFPDNDSIAEAVGEGEIPVGLVNHYYPFEVREEIPDAKVQNHFFRGRDVGSLVNVSGMGVIATSDAAAEAHQLVRFLLSEEGQRYFVERTWEYPLVPGVEADPRLPALDTLSPPDVDLSRLDDLAGTLDLLEKVGLL